MDLSEPKIMEPPITDQRKNVLEQALEQMQEDDDDTLTPEEMELAKANDPRRFILKTLLNRMFRIKMTDGRILIGFFVCTDADANVVLQLASEYTEIGGEERYLGLVMIPGRYIVSIEQRIENFSSPWFG
ncbi:N-alpha-acetyltransferase 38, NatC auxiliary subunit isoform X2 [Anopheles aquasalis]|uniref:N-alpha-acetyltransferase 38, NatC auxiliary subunit isoform X2 n=1 Tax=Anopheles aquasalis TaxID=42839 RepID=UPI00215A14C2|nr:N-alpha-acetyltransferase 38, NatC auxiliary subunit isoform X2 [Anopheles aquasalis]